MLQRLWNLLRSRRLDRELDVELGHHLESLEAEHRARGLSPEAARRAARRDFGGLSRTREDYWEQRGLPLLETLTRDVRLSLRSMRRASVVTLAVLATLAIGIGANTAIFSVVNAILIRPLPYPEADRLISISLASPVMQIADLDSAPYVYLTQRDQSRTLEGVVMCVAVLGMLTVAAGVLVVGELLLPVTPLKARAHQIAVDTTVVEDVSDAPLLSAGGRPIGIRLSYRVSFPRGGAYSVSPALALPAREATVPIPSALHLGLVREPQSTPPPFATGEAGERGYLGGVSYAFTVDLLPQFVRYASPAGEPCLVVPPNVNYSEDEFLTVVDNGLRTPYRIELLVDGQPGARRRVAWQYETAREYDVSEFYRSLVAEGVVACSA